ncbi:MAG: ATP synthase F1 subunit delta [Candidatus Hydrogenedentota bacterium]
MIRSPLLARKYAKALYDATNGKADLTGLATAAKTNPAELARPGMSRADLNVLVGGEPKSPEIRNFLGILLRRKRLRLLPEILDMYELIAEEAVGVKRATVTSATQIDAAGRARLETTLAALHSAKSIKLDVDVRPEMIGGIMIRVGDQLVDGSVKSVLEDFRSRF